MRKKLELLIDKLLADVSEEERKWLKKAFYEALSFSEIADFCISYALGSPGFRFFLDSDTKKPGALATYSSSTNTLTIHQHAQHWKVANSSDLARILVHEFTHAYFSTLHAPGNSPQDEEGLKGELFARPLVPFKDKDRSLIYDRFLKSLNEDLLHLVQTLQFFLTDTKTFNNHYPTLSAYLKELSQKYRVKFEIRSSPELQSGESCEGKYGHLLQELENGHEWTQIISGYPWIVRAYHGHNQDKNTCVFSDHVGDTEWDMVTRNLFELYWYITGDLLDQNKFNSYKRSYLNSLAPTELAFGEWMARISEIGPFFLLMRRTLTMLEADYRAYSRRKAPHSEGFEEDAFSRAMILSSTIKKEYSAVYALEHERKSPEKVIEAIYKQQKSVADQPPLQQSIEDRNAKQEENTDVCIVEPLWSPEKFIQNKHAKQTNLAAMLYGACIFGTQGAALLLGAANPSAIGAANDLASSDSVSRENEGISTTMLLAGAAALTLAGVGYTFWRRRSTTDNGKGDTPQSAQINPKARK